eukprot:4505054-Prorocentrum_lima.AAC.1
MAGRAAGSSGSGPRQTDCMSTFGLGREQPGGTYSQDLIARPEQTGCLRCCGPGRVGMVGERHVHW